MSDDTHYPLDSPPESGNELLSENVPGEADFRVRSGWAQFSADLSYEISEIIDPESEPEPENDPASDARLAFEDLTLAQALFLLLLRPIQTARLFWRVLTRDSDGTADRMLPPDDAALIVFQDEFPFESMPKDDEAKEESSVRPETVISDTGVLEEAQWPRIGVLVVALWLALQGGRALRLWHDIARAELWFVLAGAVYIGGEWWLNRAWWVQFWSRLMVRMWRRPRLPAAADTGVPERVTLPPADEVLVVRSTLAAGPDVVPGRYAWLLDYQYHLLLLPLALLCSVLAYRLNVNQDVMGHVIDVVFTPGGFIAWVASLVLWIVLLGTDIHRLLDNLRSFAPGRTVLKYIKSGTRWDFSAGWAVLALLAIMMLGTTFRLYDLAATPPEMTSDHIEKLLDARRVYEGYHGIFFPNNGGREGFQMYLVAFIAGPLGMGFSFDALKLATVFEGVITLPLLWWMARQVIGSKTEVDRQLGHWVGIVLAGLVAISSWHLMLSRLGLRIVLTPLTTALTVGFLARVMHHNRTRDYVALGAVLGAGMYFYQANRMLPILVVIGIALALLSRVRTLHDLIRLLVESVGFVALVVAPLLMVAYAGHAFTSSDAEAFSSLVLLFALLWLSGVVLIVRRRRDDPLLQYGSGLLMTVVIALAFYVPMHHYSTLYPDQFWNRTRGRLFGEQAFWQVDPTSGTVIRYEPSFREQAERFWDQRDVFIQNYRDALRMYHWVGDAAWINNVPGRPALDALAGGWLILGGIMWVVWAVWRRNPAYWLLPVGVLVMVLPSALTLAYPNENPSFTRASGSLPFVFMLAALPVGVLCWRLSQLPRRVASVPVGMLVALGLLGGGLWYGVGPNRDTFFTDYRLSYSHSWQPYREIAKPLHAFAEGEGSYGNGFMIAYPHWLDHRILGTMAGDSRWPNGLVQRDDLLDAIARNQGTPYEYNSDQPLWVMYHRDDAASAVYLDALFPGGTHMLVDYRYEALNPGQFMTESFYVFTVQTEALNE